MKGKKIKIIILSLFLISVTLLASKTTDAIIFTYKQQDPQLDSYWIKNQGYFDQVIFKVINQEELLVQALRNGEIDIVGQFVKVDLLRPYDYQNSNISLTQTRSRGFGHLILNGQKFPTSIRAFRQGFAYALDKVELQQRALGASFTADSPLVGSLGIWSCEYEFSQSPCSPTGEVYYDPRSDLGNQSLLSVGFYDFDNDGFREFYNGTVIHNGSLVWNGTSISLGNTVKTYNGYFDYRWNGYTFLGDDGIRRDFNAINLLKNGVELESDSFGSILLAPDITNTSDWIDVEFSITVSPGSQIVAKSVEVSVEAFIDLGIKVSSESLFISPFNDPLIDGTFNAYFNAFSNLSPDPTFLQIFSSDSVSNQIRSRWYNKSFDQYWAIIVSSSDFDDVLNASLRAQQILWQEQPIVVLYNNELTSIYRSDKFEGFITVPGEGAYTDWTVKKAHLKNTLENRQYYPNYPLGGSLVYGLPQFIDSQNSMVSNNAYTTQVIRTMEESLFKRHPQDLTFIPAGLAYNWTKEVPYTDNDLDNCTDCIINGSKFTFKLLSNITWHDGSNFTAKDVKFSFEMLKNNVSPVYFDSLNNIFLSRIKLVNDFEIIIYSNSSGIFELGYMQIPIYQKSYWNQFSDPVNHDNPTPSGTGPYVWVNSTPGEFYLLERYPDYYRKPIDTFEIPELPKMTSTSTKISSSTSPSSNMTNSVSPDLRYIADIFSLILISVGAFGIGAVLALILRRFEK